MSFRFKGLPSDQFAPLFKLSDSELEVRGFRRMTVDEKPGFPCRVTLADAEPGEEVLLVNFEHQPAHSPYRSIGPIFVSRAAAAYDGNDVPPALRGRQLSLRAYDRDGMMVDADVVDGREIEPVLTRLFARDDTDYVHVHNAKRGCFAARVERG